MSNLFIPTNLKVGFVKREGTFTGKLAYVIYYDEKGKIRKETSWENWRDKKIPALELDNTPRSGYVLNKGVKRDGYWGSANEYVRIHDPRDFEFEISVANLMHILMHVDLSKREIMEECVFAWGGKELYLIPVNCVEYQESLQYTAIQSNKVSAKELKPGLIYALKKSDQKLTYIGYYEYYDSSYWRKLQSAKGKRHVFHDGRNFVVPSPSTLSHAITDEHGEDFSNLVDKFFKSLHHSPIKSYKVKPIKTTSYKNKGDTIERYCAIDDKTCSKISFRQPNDYRDNSDKSHLVDSSAVYFYHQNLELSDKDSYFESDSERTYRLNGNRYTHNWGYDRPKEYVDGRIEEMLRARSLIKPTTRIGYQYNTSSFTKEEIPLTEFIKVLDELGYGKLYFKTASDKEIAYKEQSDD
jgi:hypothetical protein